MDSVIFQYINSFALKYFWLDIITIFLAKYFGWVLIGVLVIFLIKNFRKYWKMIITAFISAILARFIITEIIRWLWPRSRPFVGEEVNLLLPHSPSLSFPSGHAAFFFALSLIVYFYNKKAGILFFIASFLICLGRVMVGLHWPTDILGGVVVGLFSAWLIQKISQSRTS